MDFSLEVKDEIRKMGRAESAVVRNKWNRKGAVVFYHEKVEDWDCLWKNNRLVEEMKSIKFTVCNNCWVALSQEEKEE